MADAEKLNIDSIIARLLEGWCTALEVTGQLVTGKGYFAECGLRNAESCQRVICGKFDADFSCGMKGKVRNESIRNVTEMNIY